MGMQLTGTRTAAPREERAVSLLDARLAPTHAHVSSRDANVRKGFARVTKAGKYVLHIRPAMQRKTIRTKLIPRPYSLQLSNSCNNNATGRHMTLVRNGNSFMMAQSGGYLQGRGQVQSE